MFLKTEKEQWHFAKRSIFTGKVAWNSYLTHGLRHNCVIDQSATKNKLIHTLIIDFFSHRLRSVKIEQELEKCNLLYICHELSIWNGEQILYKWNLRVYEVQDFVQMKLQGLWGPSFCTNETPGFMRSKLLYKWNTRVYGVQAFVQMKPQGLWGPSFCANETSGFIGSKLLYKWNPKVYGIQALVQMKPQGLWVQAFVQMKPQGLWGPSFCTNETWGFMGSKLLYKWN